MTTKAKKMTIEELKEQLLIEGTDYGRVKGIPKPFLSLSGAQKIAKYYNLSHSFEIQEAAEEHKERFYFYRVQCRLIHDGVVVGDMIGSCSSHDSGKQKSPPNSILKMAEKRAYVSAVLYVVAGSGLFSADVEEMSPEELTGSDDGIKWFPSTWSNGFCAACGNKHVERGQLVAKIEGKWVAKECHEHVKAVETGSPPPEENTEINFRKTLENMDRTKLEEVARTATKIKGWNIDSFDGMDKDGLIQFITEGRK